LGGPLVEAGYQERDLTWAWDGPEAFVAVSAIGSMRDRAVAFSIRVGWSYSALGDPPPEPRIAHGCVRSLTLDELVGQAGLPLGAVGHVSEQATFELEQRLATVMRKQLVRWIEPWKRPEGFRDFLSHSELHLAAAWVSALLGHSERARLEAATAAHLHGRPLDDSFDRLRANLDESCVAPMAARHGLAAELGSAKSDVLAAFSLAPDVVARDRVLDPWAEHRRLQIRHETYTRLCLKILAAPPSL